MTPRRIIGRAKEKGLDIIAIADHNSAENLETAIAAAEKAGITVMPAMEITSSEEVHVLAYFGSLEKAARMQELVYGRLPQGAQNDEKLWGEQVVVNEADEVLGFNPRLLIGATTIPLSELVPEIHALGGLAVASHFDKGAFSVISQLGFVPEGIAFDAFEVFSGGAEALAMVPAGTALIRSSDAHRPEDIGARSTRFLIDGPEFPEIALAFRGGQGRKVFFDI